MEKQTILETPFATLWFHPDQGIVHHQIHKYIFGEHFRNLLMTGLDVLKAHRATKWLSDDRKNGALPREDREWADVNWYPRAVAEGWRYWAVVQPESVVGQMNMRKIAGPTGPNAPLGVVVGIFDDPDEAFRWIAPL